MMVAVALVAASVAQAVEVNGGAACAALAEDRARLDCYDGLFREAAGPTVAPGAAASAAAAAAPAGASGASAGASGASAGAPSADASGGARASSPGAAPGETLPSPSTSAAGDALAPASPPAVDRRGPFREYSLGLGMAHSWEITPDSRSSRFAVRTYEENYVLPLRYTSSINHAPFSPTQGVFPDRPGYRNEDVALQISLRAKVARGLLQDNDGIWLAYKQSSAWQLWDAVDSRPFRNTDYQPEILYVAPVSARLANLPGGWSLRMIQAGLVHQSNGQSDPLSRSWNRLQFRVGADNGRWGGMLGALYRLPDGSDDNPDLVEHIGSLEAKAGMGLGYSRFTLTARINPDRLSRGSVQLGLSHPIYHDDPAGLRWYLQLFSGYGQTLLDYNVRQQSVGVGVMLFQF